MTKVFVAVVFVGIVFILKGCGNSKKDSVKNETATTAKPTPTPTGPTPAPTGPTPAPTGPTPAPTGPTPKTHAAPYILSDTISSHSMARNNFNMVMSFLACVAVALFGVVIYFFTFRRGSNAQDLPSGLELAANS